MISSGEIDGSSGFVARSCPKQNKFEVMFLLRTGIGSVTACIKHVQGVARLPIH